MKKVNFSLLTQRLIPRFKLTAGVQEPLLMSETIVPVTNIDEFTRRVYGQDTTTAGTDGTDTYSVPEGKRWRILEIHASRENAGQIKATVNLTDAAGNATNPVIAFSPPSGNNVTVVFGYPLVLERLVDGSSTGISVVFGTGTTGGLLSSIVYEEEDAF